MGPARARATSSSSLPSFIPLTSFSEILPDETLGDKSQDLIHTPGDVTGDHARFIDQESDRYGEYPIILREFPTILQDDRELEAVLLRLALVFFNTAPRHHHESLAVLPAFLIQPD